MKRVISFLILIAICISLCIPCFSLYSDTPEITKVDVSNLVETDVESLFQTNDGQYIMESNGQYFSMEKTDVSFNSSTDVQRFVDNSELPEEVINSIQERYDELVQAGLTNEVTLTVFEDKGLYSLTRGGEQPPEYHTHLGLQCKSIVTLWTGLPQEMVKIYSGKPAYTSASTMTDIILLFGSFLDLDLRGKVVLGVIAGDKTAWQYYKERNPGIQKTTGSRYDFIELGFTYDFYQKYVYVYSPTFEDWLFGLEAQQAVIKNPILREHFWDDNGYDCNNLDVFISGSVVTLSSNNYKDPWKAAHEHMTVALKENISATVGNYKFVFGDFRWEK